MPSFNTHCFTYGSQTMYGFLVKLACTPKKSMDYWTSSICPCISIFSQLSTTQIRRWYHQFTEEHGWLRYVCCCRKHLETHSVEEEYSGQAIKCKNIEAWTRSRQSGRQEYIPTRYYYCSSFIPVGQCEFKWLVSMLMPSHMLMQRTIQHMKQQHQNVIYPMREAIMHNDTDTGDWWWY